MKGLFCAIFLGLLALSMAMVPDMKVCLSDDGCGDDECCYKKHDDLIVSKRGSFEGFPHAQDLTHVKGLCQTYHKQGDYCSIYDKRNGFCSCNSKMNHTCQYVGHAFHCMPAL